MIWACGVKQLLVTLKSGDIKNISVHRERNYTSTSSFHIAKAYPPPPCNVPSSHVLTPDKTFFALYFFECTLRYA
jgi:hypothetical protein